MSSQLKEQLILKGVIPENTPKKQYTRKFKQSYERDLFNNNQNFLYKRALFGLSMYEPDELQIMHQDKIKRINKVNLHAQEILNIWKQQIINSITNEFFTKTFSNSNFVRDIIDKYGNYTDTNYISTVDFKSIGMTKKHIADKLIIEGILPHNFYELKPVKKETMKIKKLDWRLFKFKKKIVNDQTEIKKLYRV